MNRKIVAALAAGAVALGVGAVGVNAASARTTGQPVKGPAPGVTSVTPVTKTSTSTLHRTAAPHRAMTHRVSRSANGAASTRAHRANARAMRVQVKRAGTQMTARAKSAPVRAKVHGKSSRITNAQAQTGMRVK
jgi:hypothetical protein